MRMEDLQSRAALRVYLVRHGETAWSLNGKHTGTTDVPLTPNGELQALALAPVLGAVTFDRVLTSPAVRARRTCELAGFGDRAETFLQLAEWDYGDYEGKRSSDIRKLQPNWSVWRDGCSGGESVRQVTDRVDGVIASLRAGSGTVLIFSHGQFGCSLAARWIGLAVLEAQHLQIDPASVGVLAFSPAHPDVPVIAQWNSVPAMLPDREPLSRKAD